MIEELEKTTRKSVFIQSDTTLYWEQHDIYYSDELTGPACCFANRGAMAAVRFVRPRECSRLAIGQQF